MSASVASRALGVAAITFHLHTPDRQRAEAQRITEGGGQLLELDHAARLRLFMNAVERRHAHIFKPGGDTFVGGQHEFFDKPVGPGALRFGHAAHLTLLVKLDYRLGQIEINAAAFLAALVHQDRKPMHPLKLWNECGVTRARLFLLVEDFGDFGVRHARSRADHAFNDFIALDAACGIELHDAAQHQPVFAGAQAANVRR